MDFSNENIIHVKEGKIEYLQFRRLLEYKDKLVHAYTLKVNNVGFKVREDNKEPVEKNFKNLKEELNIKEADIIKPEQTHSSNISIVDDKKDKYINTDGLITNKPNKMLALTYADCISLLLYDPVTNTIGNIHSGWKGTVQQIGKKAVMKMVTEFKCKPENIIGCIAPSICKNCFEVDEDVKDIFCESFESTNKLSECIKYKDNIDGKSKFLIDTTSINEFMLEEIGLLPKNIIRSNICTVENGEFFHSYRVERKLYNTNTCVIGLK